MSNHILSIILFTPLVGAILLLFVPKENKDAIRWIGNIFALAGFLVSLPLVPALAVPALWMRLWLSLITCLVGSPLPRLPSAIRSVLSP